MAMEILTQLPLVERALYGEDDVFSWSSEQRREFQLTVIREAFGFHYDRCDLFRNFCQRHKVLPSSIKSADDISKIPLIPAAAFKSMEVCSAPPDQIVKVCCSSGTQGSMSRVPRDNQSLERFLGSIRQSAEQLVRPREDAQIFNLGPDSEEAADIWLPYVMSALALLRPADNYVVESTFYVRSLLEDLLALPQSTEAFVLGPPVLLHYFLSFLEEEGGRLSLGPRVFVVTVGGWKNALSEQIDRTELVHRCINYLGLEQASNVRDVYNMVELNTVIFECEYGAKHIPPWLVIEALDVENLSPVPPTYRGLLGFYDALPTSYPGFVLSDDFGAISYQTCRCGRPGPTMDFHRRVTTVEDRGCALKIDKSTRVIDRMAHITRVSRDESRIR